MSHFTTYNLNYYYVLGNRQRYININKIHDTLGYKMCRSLAGLHAMTGCDYIPAFYRKGKKVPFKIVSQNEDFQYAFINMTEQREESFALLEKFVCRFVFTPEKVKKLTYCNI